MAARVHQATREVSLQGARSSDVRPLTEGPIHSLLANRIEAALSPDSARRNRSLSMLADMDSFSEVISCTPYDDIRELARVRLLARLCELPFSSLIRLLRGSDSQIIRAAGSEVLTQRLIRLV